MDILERYYSNSPADKHCLDLVNMQTFEFTLGGTTHDVISSRCHIQILVKERD